MDDSGDFLAHRLGLLTEYHLDQLDMTENHRGGVVDLVADTRRQFAQRRQFLAGQQARTRFTQQADVLLQRLTAFAQRGGLGAQIAGTILHLGFQCLGRELYLVAVRFQSRQHGVEFLGQFIQLITVPLRRPQRGQRAYAQALLGWGITHRMHHTANLADRLHQALDAAPHQQHPQQADRDQHQADMRQCLAIEPRVGRLRVACVDHADPLAIQRIQRGIGGHEPVTHHEGTIDIALAIADHLTLHLQRGARAQRALAAGVGDIGGDADIIEKQGDGAGAIFRQGTGAIEQIADFIDQTRVAIEQAARIQHAQQLALAIEDGHQRPQQHAAVLLAAGTGLCVGRLAQRKTRAFGKRWIQRRQRVAGQHVEAIQAFAARQLRNLRGDAGRLAQLLGGQPAQPVGIESVPHGIQARHQAWQQLRGLLIGRHQLAQVTTHRLQAITQALMLALQRAAGDIEIAAHVHVQLAVGIGRGPVGGQADQRQHQRQQRRQCQQQQPAPQRTGEVMAQALDHALPSAP